MNKNIVSLNSLIKTRNKKLEFFYSRNMGLKTPQIEDLIETMKKRLPCVIRINKSHPQAEWFRNQMQKISKDLEIEVKPMELSSNPFFRQSIFEIGVHKEKLRKESKLSVLHKLVEESVNKGIISRQELVSMIPPLFLNVTPGDRVVDLCAAPGSKTTQIIECFSKEKYLSDRNISSNNTKDSVDAVKCDPEYAKLINKSLVIANDDSPNRCQLLYHQLKRLDNPGFLISSMRGEDFPVDPLNSGENYLYDKVLCDVPCSGDAVMRKYPEQWGKWSPMNGIRLHRIQLGILLKGASLLKEDGCLVYSTCSMNPVENEAVIAQFLRETNFNRNCEYEYVVNDCRKEFDKEFKYREGLGDWELYIEDTFFKPKEKETYKGKVDNNRKEEKKKPNKKGKGKAKEEGGKKSDRSESSGRKSNEKTEEKISETMIEKDEIISNKFELEPNTGITEKDKIEEDIIIENNLKPFKIQDTSAYLNLANIPSSIFSPQEILSFTNTSNLPNDLCNSKNTSQPEDNELSNTKGNLHSQVTDDTKKLQFNLIQQSLKNVVRVFPTDNDTSGFFIARLVKKRKEPDSLFLRKDKRDKRPKTKSYQCPYLEAQIVRVSSFPCNIQLLNWLVEYYGLAEGFDLNCLVTKSEKARNIYIVGKAVSELLVTKNSRIRSYAAGIKLFEPTGFTNDTSTYENKEGKEGEEVKKGEESKGGNDSKETDLPLNPDNNIKKETNKESVVKAKETNKKSKHYRISTGGVPVILPYMKKRVLCTTNKALFNLIVSSGQKQFQLSKTFQKQTNHSYSLLHDIEDLEPNTIKEELKNSIQSPSVQNYIDGLFSLSNGCFVMVLLSTDAESIEINNTNIMRYYVNGVSCIKAGVFIYPQISQDSLSVIVDE